MILNQNPYLTIYPAFAKLADDLLLKIVINSFYNEIDKLFFYGGD